MKPSSAAVLICIGLLAGCASGQTEPKEQPQSQAQNEAKNPLGQKVSQGSEQISREQQVTETKTVQIEVPTVRVVKTLADINRMNPEQFQAFGFTPQASKDIVQYRNDHGQFSSPDDLARIPGVSQAMLNGIKDKLGASTG
jgi:DNA uptake protein ComE-like DNA-binding protein